MLILCSQGDTACTALFSQKTHILLTPLQSDTNKTSKHNCTVWVWSPICHGALENQLSLLSNLCPSHRLTQNQQYSLLKAAWLKGHWCWTLSPDTFNLKQSTLVWLTRPSADRRQNKTHCFLFQDCALVRLLCVCVRMCIKHYIIVSLQVKNSPVRAAADLLGAVQSKDITVGLSMWEYDDLLTL